MVAAALVALAAASAACAPGAVSSPTSGSGEPRGAAGVDATASPAPAAAETESLPADTTPPEIASLSASPTSGAHPFIAPKRFEIGIVVSDAAAVASESPASLMVRAVITRAGTASPVRSFNTTTSSGAVANVTWDLLNSRGAIVPPGVYRVEVSATDSARNTSATRTVSVRVLTLALVAARATGTRAKAHAAAIAALGVRKAGGSAERRAAGYVEARFREFGYTSIRKPAVPLKDGSTSLNVVAVKPGASARAPIVIVGAHMDSRADKRSPGGNDNASGVGVLLETARVMAGIPTTSEIWFVAFGAEEIYDGNPDHHHEGSRALAKSLTRDQLRRGVKMVNIDMVGVGRRLQLGTQRGATETYARYHLGTARALGFDAEYASHGSGSDHEQFVKMGIPVAYYDRGPDPHYHTPNDTADRVSATALLEASRTLVATLIRHAAR